MNLKRIIALMLIYVMAMPSIATAKASGGQNDYACVYAKTGIGFVATADWYSGSKLIRSDQIPVWQWQCMPEGQGVDHVVISGLGMSKAGGNAVKGGIAVAAGAAAVAACVFTAGIGCIVEAGVVAGATAFAAGAGATSAISQYMPDPGPWAVDIPLVNTDFTKATFAGNNPHPKNYEGPQYIELWGTVWNPQMLLHNERCDGCL